MCRRRCLRWFHRNATIYTSREEEGASGIMGIGVMLESDQIGLDLVRFYAKFPHICCYICLLILFCIWIDCMINIL